MRKSDKRTALFLTIAIVVLVISLTTGFLDRIILPLGLLIFVPVAAGFMFALVFYSRRYMENHPYIPYVGRWAHVLCKECMKANIESSRIDVSVGYAFEGWTKAGRYFRGFKREYTAMCDRGHKWTFDPILERNIVEKEARRKRTPEEKAAAKQRSIERSRAVREMFHKTFVAPF